MDSTNAVTMAIHRGKKNYASKFEVEDMSYYDNVEAGGEEPASVVPFHKRFLASSLRLVFCFGQTPHDLFCIGDLLERVRPDAISTVHAQGL